MTPLHFHLFGGLRQNLKTSLLCKREKGRPYCVRVVAGCKLKVRVTCAWGIGMDYREKSGTRDGMRIDWDMPILSLLKTLNAEETPEFLWFSEF
jgi:hypothetical protein